MPFDTTQAPQSEASAARQATREPSVREIAGEHVRGFVVDTRTAEGRAVVRSALDGLCRGGTAEGSLRWQATFAGAKTLEEALKMQGLS